MSAANVRHALQSAIDLLRRYRTVESLRTATPYCFQPVANAERLILLNRNYKPVGHAGTDWVDHAEFPNLIVEKHRIVYGLAQLASNWNGAFYFFDDSCAPWHGAKCRERLIAIIREFCLCADEEQKPPMRGQLLILRRSPGVEERGAA